MCEFMADRVVWGGVWVGDGSVGRRLYRVVPTGLGDRQAMEDGRVVGEIDSFTRSDDDVAVELVMLLQEM